jgi:hypothetical protein
LETVRAALEGHAELDPGAFADWLRARHELVDRGQLVYIAHQLDYFGLGPNS